MLKELLQSQTRIECGREVITTGYFGHQVNSAIHLQTVEILMRRLIRISTVCCVSLFFLFQKLKNETNKVAVRNYLMSEVT